MRRNPLPVLGEIPLSGLPEPPAEVIGFCLALLHAGQSFHLYPETSGTARHRTRWFEFVSVLLPMVSHRASWRRVSAWREEFPQDYLPGLAHRLASHLLMELLTKIVSYFRFCVVDSCGVLLGCFRCGGELVKVQEKCWLECSRWAE